MENMKYANLELIYICYLHTNELLIMHKCEPYMWASSCQILKQLVNLCRSYAKKCEICKLAAHLHTNEARANHSEMAQLGYGTSL